MRSYNVSIRGGVAAQQSLIKTQIKARSAVVRMFGWAWHCLEAGRPTEARVLRFDELPKASDCSVCSIWPKVMWHNACLVKI